MSSHNVLNERIPIKVLMMSKNNAYAVFHNLPKIQPIQNFSFFCYVTAMPTTSGRLLTSLYGSILYMDNICIQEA